MEKNEVFLGQKKSIARYDLDQQKPTWSLEIEETPGIMTTYNKYLFAQCVNKWGTKYIHYMVDAISGEILWRSDLIKSYILPHYLEGDMFYTNTSGQICKLELKTGKVIFEEKFAGVFTRSSFILFLTDTKVYLTSKKKTLLVNQANGTTSEVNQLSKFTTSKITVASGVGRDQISTVILSLMAAQSGGDPSFVGGDGGGGGGDGG
ncbi:PQQ-like beta-propeller repeat protein [Gammaproteobacteria bacterium]|nr:PQQ-like beta-propeller repeat protein [Gammaproteobacteria bacterium]